MNPIRKQRLLLIAFLVVGIAAAVGMMLFALSENINHYFSPTQMAIGEAPVAQRVRGGGLVVMNSLQRDANSLLVRFEITDGKSTVPVEYEGILPDLFQEGSGVVAMGQLTAGGRFVASEVLAKHDENYMPPEVQYAIDTAHNPNAAATDSANNDSQQSNVKE